MSTIFFSFTIFLPLKSQDISFNRLYDYMGYWQTVASIIETEDGYIAAMKNTGSTYELNRIILMGLDNTGYVLWTEPYFLDSTVVYVTSPQIEKSEDGNYVLAGTIQNPQLPDGYNHNALLMKFNGQGHMLWQKTYGNEKNDVVSDFKKTPDGGYIIGGFSRNEDEEGDFYLIKINGAGELEWESYLGGEGWQHGYSVDCTPDGGYVISGRGGNPPFAVDIAVAKCDSLGNQLWSNIYGGPHDNDSPHRVIALEDGNILISGGMGNGEGSYATKLDGFLIKLNQDGEVIWEKIYDEPYTFAHTSNILELEDNSLVVTGIRYPSQTGDIQATLSKYGNNGALIWRRIYSSPNPEIDTYLYGLTPASDGGFLAYGSAYDPNWDNFQEGWLIKTDSEGYTCEEVNCVVVDVEEAQLKATEQLEVFPNPTTGILNINWQGESEVQLGIYALDGTLVWAGEATGKSRQVDIGWMPAGLYFVQARGEEGLWQRKVVKQ